MKHFKCWTKMLNKAFSVRSVSSLLFTVSNIGFINFLTWHHIIQHSKTLPLTLFLSDLRSTQLFQGSSVSTKTDLWIHEKLSNTQQKSRLALYVRLCFLKGCYKDCTSKQRQTVCKTYKIASNQAAMISCLAWYWQKKKKASFFIDGHILIYVC